MAGDPPARALGRGPRPRAALAVPRTWPDLARRDLQLRYRQALFGVAWAVLQPALAMLLFSVLLGDLAGVPSDGLPYSVFVIAGLAPWFFISGAVSAAADSLVEHRELVTKVWFPRLLAPTAAVLAATVDLLIGMRDGDRRGARVGRGDPAAGADPADLAARRVRRRARRRASGSRPRTCSTATCATRSASCSSSGSSPARWCSRAAWSRAAGPTSSPSTRSPA